MYMIIDKWKVMSIYPLINYHPVIYFENKAVKTLKNNVIKITSLHFDIIFNISKHVGRIFQHNAKTISPTQQN